MAHLGRDWERLFRRDLGFKPDLTPFQYLPKRYTFFGNGFTPFPGLRFVAARHVSDVGSWDEGTRTITYFFSDPGTWTPGISKRFEYHLTDDPRFWEGRVTIAVSGVDKVYVEVWSSEWPLTTINASDRAHYVAPYTGPDTAWSTPLHPCSWADAPP